MRIMKLSDIKITEAFTSTTPKKHKMDACRNHWLETGTQDRYIVVNKDNILIDGYIQYLVLKENGIEEAEVIIDNKKSLRWRRKRESDWNIPAYRNIPTTYVYGYHPDNLGVEYMWRVPNAWTWVAENIKVGDMVFGRTVYGVAPVVVTKVEVLNKCPIDGVVKKICSKSIIRNGMLVE